MRRFTDDYIQGGKHERGTVMCYQITFAWNIKSNGKPVRGWSIASDGGKFSTYGLQPWYAYTFRSQTSFSIWGALLTPCSPDLLRFAHKNHSSLHFHIIIIISIVFRRLHLGWEHTDNVFMSKNSTPSVDNLVFSAIVCIEITRSSAGRLRRDSIGTNACQQGICMSGWHWKYNFFFVSSASIGRSRILR